MKFLESCSCNKHTKISSKFIPADHEYLKISEWYQVENTLLESIYKHLEEEEKVNRWLYWAVHYKNRHVII